MALAALCRQWIPQQLLLEYMGLNFNPNSAVVSGSGAAAGYDDGCSFKKLYVFFTELSRRANR